MTIVLPDPISAYIAADNAGDPAAAAQCFVEDAVVHDEGQTHTGVAAITQWKAETTRTYRYTMQPIATAVRNGKTVVASRVTGNFPGSPIELELAFGLAGGKISSLEIS